MGGDPFWALIATLPASLVYLGIGIPVARVIATPNSSDTHAEQYDDAPRGFAVFSEAIGKPWWRAIGYYFAGALFAVSLAYFLNLGNVTATLTDGTVVMASGTNDYNTGIYVTGNAAGYISFIGFLAHLVFFYKWPTVVFERYSKMISLGSAVVQAVFSLLATIMFAFAFSFSGTTGLYRHSVLWIPVVFSAPWLLFSLHTIVFTLIHLNRK